MTEKHRSNNTRLYVALLTLIVAGLALFSAFSFTSDDSMDGNDWLVRTNISEYFKKTDDVSVVIIEDTLNNKAEEQVQDTLPKRMRYYHGLIDTQLLSSGVGYAKLPNVIIIVILPYDPFGQNRMVYTIQNQCFEDTLVPYDDGAKKIFLYTRGTEGKPGQALKDMLKYIQNTTDYNITNQDIASVHELVNKVKHKKEVSISYMKSWEVEEMARMDGRNRVNQLIIKLTEVGRTEDIIKAARDTEYQETLFEEFDL